MGDRPACTYICMYNFMIMYSCMMVMRWDLVWMRMQTYLCIYNNMSIYMCMIGVRKDFYR